MTEVSGSDNKVKTFNNCEFLSFDNRKSKDGGEQCNTWSYLSIESFEFMAIGLLIIFLFYKGGKKICGKDGLLKKGGSLNYNGMLLSLKNFGFFSKIRER